MRLEVTVSLCKGVFFASNCNTRTHQSVNTIRLILYVFPCAVAERAEHPARWGLRCQRRQPGPQRCVFPSGQRPPVTALLTLPLYVHSYPCPSHALPLRLWGHAGGAGSCDEAERPDGEPVPGRAVSGPPQWPWGATTLQPGEWEEVPLHEGGNSSQIQKSQDFINDVLNRWHRPLFHHFGADW